MKKSLFEYRDYKKYLVTSLEQKKEHSRGLRSRLAEALHCHTAYISQVLNGEAHFSLEQAEQASQFLGHDKEHTLFFINLVQLARAGTSPLRKIFEEQIEAHTNSYYNLKNRLDFKKVISTVEQSQFYSSWHYAAIHVLVSIPGCNTVKGISDFLGISSERVQEVLLLLTQISLIKKTNGRFEIDTSHVHLGTDSYLISKHHTNWRLRSILSLDHVKSNDLHYSSVVTISRNDSVEARIILVKAIEQVRALVKDSKDEESYCYTLDFFNMKA